MRPHQLQPAAGSKHPRKRLGRGDGSRGTTSGKGTKGQKARAGGGVRPYFEGGQNPMVKRMPHVRGFTNIFRTEYVTVNVGQLNRLEGDEPITAERLAAAGLIPSAKAPLKVLGDGELSKPVTVRAVKFSGSARSKIQAAGGRAEGADGTVEAPEQRPARRRPVRRTEETEAEAEVATNEGPPPEQPARRRRAGRPSDQPEASGNA
jgi:large subunit ribosomal protein L15